MTNEQIADSTLYRLHALSESRLDQEQFEAQAAAIIADAVAAGRLEGEAAGFAKGEAAGFAMGEAAGFAMGTRHACEVHAFVLDQCFLRPTTAAEVAKAEE